MKAIRLTIVAVFVGLLVLLTFIFVNPNVTSAIEYQKKRLTFAYTEFVDRLFVRTPAAPETPVDPDKAAYTVPVFVYHGLVDDGSVYSMPEATFESHMAALYQAGYRTISLQQLDSFLKNKTAIPEKSFIITFDDGRKDSFYRGDAIIKKFGFTAVMFMPGVILASNSFSSVYYLDKNDVRLLNETGRWEIGSHGMQTTGGYIVIDDKGTQGQFLSNKIWLKNAGRVETDEEYIKRVNAELHESKVVLEHEMGLPVIAFSYPFGDYGQDSKNARAIAATTIAKAVTTNYELAFQQVRPLNGMHVGVQEIDNQYFLSRIEPKNEVNNWSAEKLLTHVRAGEVKTLPFDSTKAVESDWKTSWGGYTFENGNLNLFATPQAEGGFSSLDGSFTWRDYIFASEIDWKAGSHLLLVARVQSNSNYVQCSFNDQLLRIEVLQNGTRKILQEIKNSAPIIGKRSVHVAMAVHGDQVICYLEGVPVIMSDTPGELPERGAVGVKIWDQTPNLTNMSLLRFQVESYSPENLRHIAQFNQPSTQ